VTVQGRDLTKVALSVNGVLNGGDVEGTIRRIPGKEPGVWTYTAPAKVPEDPVVSITASLEDATKPFYRNGQSRERKPGPAKTHGKEIEGQESPWSRRVVNLLSIAILE
jgi:hypothetical protein